MIRALAVCTVLAATATTASAGVYGALGVGNTGVDDSANHFTDDGRSLRLTGGYQFTPYLSAEGGFMGFGAAFRVPYDGRELYAAGLFHWPIANGFEAYGRLGFEHTTLDQSMGSSSSGSFAGNGYLFGAGFEYKLQIPTLPVPHVGVFVDYTRNNNSLSLPAETSRSVGVSMWTLGVIVGL